MTHALEIEANAVAEPGYEQELGPLACRYYHLHTFPGLKTMVAEITFEDQFEENRELKASLFSVREGAMIGKPKRLVRLGSTTKGARAGLMVRARIPKSAHYHVLAVANTRSMPKGITTLDPQPAGSKCKFGASDAAGESDPVTVLTLSRRMLIALGNGLGAKRVS